MKSRSKIVMKPRLLALALVSGGTILFGLSLSQAQQSLEGEKYVGLQTSINAVMVDLVDHAAHFLWDASYKPQLSGRDWQQVEQHAIQLVASGTLISLPGNGPADQGWVMSPAWQEWSQKLTDGGLEALAAVKNTDQRALERAGDTIVATCQGCHDAFKPETPTEGIMHIPHYDE
jgi:cytochrome c553